MPSEHNPALAVRRHSTTQLLARRAATPATSPYHGVSRHRPLRRRALSLIALHALAPICWRSHGANWAETNGVKEQQTSLVTYSPFTARYGHACVVVDSGPSAFDYIEDAENAGFTERSVDRLICIGGDDHDEVKGGGGLRNDVWQTSGINWRIAKAYTILNEYDDPRVSTVSDMTWSPVVDSGLDRLPPEGVSYMTWIACPIAELGLQPPPGIECRYEVDANEWGSKRFSPRRHHAAVTFRASGDSTSRIYVLGGRSRVLVDYPDGWERVHGGFRDRLEASEAGEHFREENTLMNDIWVSPSEDSAELLPGEEWGLVNPGCITQYSPFSLPTEQQVWANGSASARCTSSDDCGGDATCDVSRSLCVCNIWSPREQHAVAVYKNKIFVTGGFTWLDLHTCAGRSCGGGFRAVLNDVWWSTDAYSWLTIGYGTKDAPWGPRAGHQLVVPSYTKLFKLSGGPEDSLLYLLGGQTFSTTDSNTTEFHADVWATADGATWYQMVETGSDVSYPARSNHFAAMIDDVMVVTGGYDADGGRYDTWSWDRSDDSATSDRFVLDFDNGTDFEEYVTDASPVTVIPFITAVSEAKLNSLDVFTVTDLARIAPWKIKRLQDFNDLDYPDICLHIKWAEAILNNCIAVIEPLDYVEWNGTFEREDDWDAKLKSNQTKSQAQITEETDFCAEIFVEWTGSWTKYLLHNQEEPFPFPLKCKSEFGQMAMVSGAVYQERVWVVGGLIGQSSPAVKTNNVWYREPHIPSTTFITKPRTQTSDQLFEFGCSDTFNSWCRYQYRILDMSEKPPVEVRHWCDSNYQLDYGQYWYGGWLPRGDYRLQVRAVGPSGNKESSFQEGRNQHTWTHIPIPPWALIISMILLVLLTILAVVIYYRYKARKAALQRYAMKRMRRKFKRMQKLKAGKLHKDRGERVQEEKAEAVVKETVQQRTAEENEISKNKMARRRRKGPAVSNSEAVAASL
jgi:hypothetical protein